MPVVVFLKRLAYYGRGQSLPTVKATILESAILFTTERGVGFSEEFG